MGTFETFLLQSCGTDSFGIFGYADFFYSQCLPYKLGDGRCDHQCNINWGLMNDKGDCNQLCFAEESLTSNCSFDKLDDWRNWWRQSMAEKSADLRSVFCDEGCNSQYCMTYFGGNF